MSVAGTVIGQRADEVVQRQARVRRGQFGECGQPVVDGVIRMLDETVGEEQHGRTGRQRTL